MQQVLELLCVTWNVNESKPEASVPRHCISIVLCHKAVFILKS